MIIRLVQPKQPLFVETPDSMEREEWNTKRLRYSLLSNKRFVRENQNRIPLTQSDRADIILIHLVYVAVTDDSAHWRWTIFCIFLSFSDFHYWIHFATTLFPFFWEISVFIMPREKRKNEKIDHNTNKDFQSSLISWNLPPNCRPFIVVGPTRPMKMITYTKYTDTPDIFWISFSITYFFLFYLSLTVRNLY